jgi:hypothetical protein
LNEVKEYVENHPIAYNPFPDFMPGTANSNSYTWLNINKLDITPAKDAADYFTNTAEFPGWGAYIP